MALTDTQQQRLVDMDTVYRSVLQTAHHDLETAMKMSYSLHRTFVAMLLDQMPNHRPDKLMDRADELLLLCQDYHVAVVDDIKQSTQPPVDLLATLEPVNRRKH